MPRLVTNAWGQVKAERFRRHFGLTPLPDSYGGYGVTPDAHDYLHTVLGKRHGNSPYSLQEEVDVLAYEEQIFLGQVPIPRGCELLL